MLSLCMTGPSSLHPSIRSQGDTSPSSKPGVVIAKQHSDSAGKEHNILKDSVVVDPDGMPPVVEPKGLSSQRQWYLFDKIREFCPAAD